MRLAPKPYQPSPFAAHNIKAGLPLYQAALEHAQQAHKRRCGDVPAFVSAVADRHAEESRKLSVLAGAL
jgi:hypothetical protein